jgi:hypothetical protein
MRKTIAAALTTLLLSAAPALAQTSTTFRDERGQITGTASTSGGVTIYRDRLGRETGTAEHRRDGGIQFRDARGRLIGASTAPRR